MSVGAIAMSCRLLRGLRGADDVARSAAAHEVDERRRRPGAYRQGELLGTAVASAMKAYGIRLSKSQLWDDKYIEGYKNVATRGIQTGRQRKHWYGSTIYGTWHRGNVCGNDVCAK